VTGCFGTVNLNLVALGSSELFERHLAAVEVASRCIIEALAAGRVIRRLVLPLLSILMSGLIVATVHEFKALSIFHGRSVLDRLLVLFVVESHIRGVEVQEVSDLIGHIGADLFVTPILKPHLDQSLFGAERKGGSDDPRFLKLLANERKEHGLPHLVDVILFLDFDDPHAAQRGFFPHGHLLVSEEE